METTMKRQVQGTNANKNFKRGNVAFLWRDIVAVNLNQDILIGCGKTDGYSNKITDKRRSTSIFNANGLSFFR